MSFNWIFHKDYAVQVILVACFSFLLTTFTYAAGPPRPMLISLPINVRASMPEASPNFYDLEESAEEQRVDERFIFRGNNPQNDYVQEDNDSEKSPQPGFLSWNPGTQFIMLQLNDVISARRPDEDNDSDESVRAESSRPRKQHRRQQKNDLPEMEDYRRILEPTRWPNASTKKTKASFVKYMEQSGEEEMPQVYGAEPIVQYLKENKTRKNGSTSIYKDMQQDEMKDFNVQHWWGDYRFPEDNN